MVSVWRHEKKTAYQSAFIITTSMSSSNSDLILNFSPISDTI